MAPDGILHLSYRPTVAHRQAIGGDRGTSKCDLQTLGGLGLVLGTIGIAAVTARNVLERRRELALFSAAGYPTGTSTSMRVMKTSP